MPRVWFITDCPSGFGRQFAITAAKDKDIVVATSRNPSKLSDLASIGVIAKKLDLSASDAEVKAAIDNVESTVGPIDILVNNTGYILEGATKKLSINSTSTSSHKSASSAALSFMRARKSGVVVNFGSIGSWLGSPAAGIYCASKAAIAIYTESLRDELAPFNIEVTCVEPGYFRTNFLTGGHKIIAKHRIPELDVGTKATWDALVAYSLNQPGDPIKGAQVLFEAFTKTGRCEGRSLPGRLALGRDSLATIGGSIAREEEMLDSWKEIIASTDCDDVEA